MIDWLPGLLRLEDYCDDWSIYFEAIYGVFLRDFAQNKPAFRGRLLGLKKYPEYEGKPATFWHMISEGHVEEKRIPDLRRCERIAWPAPVIEHSTDQEIRCWRNEHKGDKRIVLWLVEEDYVVILSERNGYLIPWTAYLLTYQHSRDKMEREYNAYIKAKGAPF